VYYHDGRNRRRGCGRCGAGNACLPRHPLGFTTTGRRRPDHRRHLQMSDQTPEQCRSCLWWYSADRGPSKAPAETVRGLGGLRLEQTWRRPTVVSGMGELRDWRTGGVASAACFVAAVEHSVTLLAAVVSRQPESVVPQWSRGCKSPWRNGPAMLAGHPKLAE
jgi:hypothetical protein